MRKKALLGAAFALIAAAGVARAQVQAEAIPAEFLAQFTPIAVELIRMQFPDPPVKVDPAGDKVSGYRLGDLAGAVIVPDKNFTAKSLDEATDKEVPVGILATRALSVQDKDAVVGPDRLAIAELNAQIKFPVFFLSVKGKGADRTLEVYSKGGKALTSVPLKKEAGDAAQAVGVKLTNIDVEKKKLDVTVSLNGTHTATVNMGFIEP